jgi:hypothetical protein
MRFGCQDTWKKRQAGDTQEAKTSPADARVDSSQRESQDTLGFDSLARPHEAKHAIALMGC